MRPDVPLYVRAVRNTVFGSCKSTATCLTTCYILEHLHPTDVHCENWKGPKHVALMGERRDVYRVLVGKSEGKRPLGRPRHKWEDNIKMDIQNVGCGGMDWIKLD